MSSYEQVSTEISQSNDFSTHQRLEFQEGLPHLPENDIPTNDSDEVLEGLHQLSSETEVALFLLQDGDSDMMDLEDGDLAIDVIDLPHTPRGISGEACAVDEVEGDPTTNKTQNDFNRNSSNPTVKVFSITSHSPSAIAEIPTSASGTINQNEDLPNSLLQNVPSQTAPLDVAMSIEAPIQLHIVTAITNSPSSPADFMNQVSPAVASTPLANLTMPANYPPVVYPEMGFVQPSQQASNPMRLNAILNKTNHQIGLTAMEGEESDDEDDEDEDDDGEDDDMSSELSDGTDLQSDLQDALESSNFAFTGTFYHAGLLPSAPNPCLFISGLGLVGLPLSDRDAKSIISCATLAPFGHGERTVVDTSVRDTWEIEPARVSFANKQWGQYISETVCAQVCQSLGVAITANSAPRMELYKLLLYETGSHFLPHQDTQKTNGMFATVIVLLPSAYIGGQLIVSHASTTKTIDFAQNSLFSTALLAWYTDVKHEVKPVTSGYRLALSYNLIHVAAVGIPFPTVPSMNDTAALLRRVLRKWRDGMYGQNIIAYLLDHEYSSANLRAGFKILKGVDAHRVRFLHPVAEEMGFRVGLASLAHDVFGSADDDGESYYNDRRRNRWGEYESDSDKEVPTMGEVDGTNTSITGLVDLNGTPLVSSGNITIEDDCLIPNNPFEDETPDDEDYEGYMGNYAGQVEHHYRRTVMVLMHEDHMDDICFRAEGVPYAFQMLKRSTTVPPSDADRAWATRLLNRSHCLNMNHVTTLITYSFKWKDVAMWKSIIKCSVCTLKTLDHATLLQAWNLFSFQNVCVSFEELLARSTEVPERIHFIHSLSPNAIDGQRPVVDAWCKKESDKVLSSYSTANTQDMPTIMSIIRVAGLRSFISSTMPNLSKKSGTYNFWIALRKSLIENRHSILEREAETHSGAPLNPTVPSTEAIEPPATQASDPQIRTAQALDDLMKTCLRLAVTDWPNGASSYNSQSSKINRIIELIELCVVNDEMDLCKTLLITILKVPGAAATKFPQLYTPLIPHLRSLLARLNRDIYSPPFIDLIQVFIGTYLREVLGKRGHILNCNLRKIGCGCYDCQSLDAFVMDPKTTETTIRLAQARRLHIEGRVARSPDLCTFQTIKTGSPHGVKIKKLPAVIQASQWEYKQKAAQAFLASIGSNDVIARIMGARYADVNNAINGTQLFGSVQAVPVSMPIANRPPSYPTMTGVATRRIIPINAPTQASSSSAVFQQTNTQNHQIPTATVGPKKRKSAPVILGPIIDLTGDSS